MEDDKQIKTKPNAIVRDTIQIIEQARNIAYRSINSVLAQRNRLLGYRIEKEILKGERAEYGKGLIQKLANTLTPICGAGFDMSSLYKYVRFYNTFPVIISLQNKEIENQKELFYLSQSEKKNIRQGSRRNKMRIYHKESPNQPFIGRE